MNTGSSKRPDDANAFLLRIRMMDRPGALGSVATRIGAVRADLTGIAIIERRDGWVVDELEVTLPEPDLADLLIREVTALEDVVVEALVPLEPPDEGDPTSGASASHLGSGVDSSGRPQRHTTSTTAHGPGSSTMPKAYWISAYHAVHDEEKLAAYAALAGPAIAGAGGRFLARGVAAKAYEAGLVQRTVVVEFESLEAAEACHDGEAYQAALAALGDGVTRDLRIVEGLDA